MAEANFLIQLKDPNNLTTKLAGLINLYEELLDMIPEWSSIEAKQKADEIGTILSNLLELKNKT